jgi:hypothetical protein
MSLNCAHQLAYCSSPRSYMSMENHGGIIPTEEYSRSVLQSTLWKSYQQSHVVVHLGNLGEGNGGFCVRNISFALADFLACSKILRHGADGFTSSPNEGVLRMLIALKIPKLRPGLNPRTLGPMVSTLNITPLRRL